ncbi:MAG: pyruvate kinase, partial [Planctomycetaceae bacterium]
MSTGPAIVRTKIVATVGPACNEEAMLRGLVESGVDVFRLNMAHASHAWTREVIRRIRAVSVRQGREVGIMM